jgi:thiol-disulfide isomerase/thioredoxin
VPYAAALLVCLTGAALAKPKIVPADVKAVLAEIRKPGARAVLVNVWATWCEPCLEEMPELLRAWRAHKDRGLRLVLVSADDEETRGEAEKFLASQGVNFPTFLKTGDDMTFIDGLDKRWTGALPASFLFDGQGKVLHFWPKQVTERELTKKLEDVLRRRKR